MRMYRRFLIPIYACTKLFVAYCKCPRFVVPVANSIHGFPLNRKFHRHYVLHNSKVNNSQIVPASFFENITNKSKETYLDMVHIYEIRNPQRRAHVEFIYAALKHMKDFGVEKDLEVYKSLINVLPKGKFIPTNVFQAEFMHYPKQQQCIVDVLEQMEENGVIPDEELETILLNIFGSKGHPLRKYWRMMYWMPKFKNLTPWPLPNPLPNDSLELAKLAIMRITSVDVRTKISVYKTADLVDSIEDTWIVSGQSPVQKQLLERHPENQAVYVKGVYKVWLRGSAVNYFVLMAKAVPKERIIEDDDDVSNLKMPFFEDRDCKSVAVEQSVHEQDSETIFSVCASGTSSKDSLLSWIRHLEIDGNPCLGKIPVLFTLKSVPGEELPVIDEGTSSLAKSSD